MDTEFMVEPDAPTWSLADAKALAFTTALAFPEFLAAASTYAPLMSRRYAEVRVPFEVQAYLVDYPDALRFVALVTPDDPDTVTVLPVLVRLIEAAPRFALRIVRDDDDLTLLNSLLDEIDLIEGLDELDLPLLFVFDDEWRLQEQWGPRPATADPLLDAWMEAHPEYDSLADDERPEAQEEYARLLRMLTLEMRIWYNSGLDADCFTEIRSLLASLQPEEVETDDEAAETPSEDEPQ